MMKQRHEARASAPRTGGAAGIRSHFRAVNPATDSPPEMQMITPALAGIFSPGYDFIAKRIMEKYERKADYQFLWREQHVGMVVGQADHCRKIFQKTKVVTVRIGVYRLTLMNELGQPVLCLNVFSESYHDPAVIAAFNALRWAFGDGRAQPQLLYLDNPMNDGAALISRAPMWWGDSEELDMPTLKFEYDNITYVHDEYSSEYDAVTQALMASQVVGFDIEFYAPLKKGHANHPPAVIQMCSGKNDLAVYHIHRFDDKLPRALRDLLFDSSIKKVGCNINNDITLLKKHFPDYASDWDALKRDGLIELTTLANQKLKVLPRSMWKLADLVCEVLHERLDKSIGADSDATGLRKDNGALSNWERRGGLTTDQVQYAANDAWAGLACYRVLSQPRLIADQDTEADLMAHFYVTAIEDETIESIAAKCQVDTRALFNLNFTRFPGLTITAKLEKDTNVLLPEPLQESAEMEEAERHEEPQPRRITRSMEQQWERDQDLVSVVDDVVSAPAGSSGSVEQAEVEDEDDIPFGHERQEATTSILNVLMKRIDQYLEQEEQSVMVFPSMLSSKERKALHDYCDMCNQQGSPTKLKAWTPKPEEGLAPALHVCVDLAAPAPEDIDVPVDVDWVRKKHKCDPRHFFGNWFLMSQSKTSRLFKYFVTDTANALFKEDPKRRKELETHLKKLKPGIDLETVAKRYFRQNGVFSCPQPERIIRDLTKVYRLYLGLHDPDTGLPFYQTGHDAIRKRMLQRVAVGLLSDPPGMRMYLIVGVHARTGLKILRCIRTTSPLEGYHTHANAQNRPGARASNPRKMDARLNQFDFEYAVWAGRLAGIYDSTRHHCDLPLMDMLYHILVACGKIMVGGELKSLTEVMMPRHSPTITTNSDGSMKVPRLRHGFFFVL